MGKRVLGHPKIYLLPLHNFQRTRNTPHPPLPLSEPARPSSFLARCQQRLWRHLQEASGTTSWDLLVLLFHVGVVLLGFAFFVRLLWMRDRWGCCVSHLANNTSGLCHSSEGQGPTKSKRPLPVWCHYSSRCVRSEEIAIKTAPSRDNIRWQLEYTHARRGWFTHTRRVSRKGGKMSELLVGLKSLCGKCFSLKEYVWLFKVGMRRKSFLVR